MANRFITTSSNLATTYYQVIDKNIFRYTAMAVLACIFTLMNVRRK